MPDSILDIIDTSYTKEDLQIAIMSGADVNDVCPASGANVLHYCVDVMLPDVEVLRVLIDNNVYVDHTDFRGETPLHWAVRSNIKTTAIRFLVASGARVNAQNVDGDTPAHFAVAGEYPAIVKFLIMKNANLALRNRNGETPYDVALRHKNLDKTVMNKLKAGKNMLAERRK